MKPAKILLLVLVLSAPTSAEGWGALTGRLVVEGDLPEPTPLTLGNDATCHSVAPVDESVLVGKQGGLQNAVVYVRPPRGAELPVHPDLKSEKPLPVELTNRRCAFTPRVSIVRTGQPLIVKNADPTAHNTKFDLLKNTPLNRLIPAEGDFRASFDLAESRPIAVSCNIHPFMRGYLLVRDDPYAAVTDAEGQFRIEKLPAGEHQFQFWHETGSLKNVAVSNSTTDRRGRVRLTIPAAGELDLGTITIPSKMLARHE